MRCAAIAVCAAMLLWPLASHAANGVKPRTPMLWDPPCMTRVDRSVDAQLHIPYDIPHEDPAEGESITADEVVGSRTHQFFAFAREADQVTLLPGWINALDVEAALAKGLIEDDSVGVDDVLETADAWTDAWTRITPDDPRRPIDLETAAAGVDWDTTGLPVGAYTLQGYTYEPQFNLWTPRSGVIKVHDGDPDEAGPAVAFDQVVLALYRNGSELLTGCIDAPAGTSVDGQWSLVSPGTPLSWQSFGEATIDGAALQIELPAPADAAGRFIAVRLVATSPAGDSYPAHMHALASVLEADDPDACDEGGSFVGQPGCGGASSDDGATGDGSTGAGTSSDTGAGEAPATGDGGCRTGGATPGPLSLALALLCAARRRRGARTRCG